ncbi:MAG TPA: hypothetical protein VJS69_04050 [Candidatus Krumholzibacteria bacterium]|nr:hypothetical protein [Candidatus Krumholzibacteria bacterium]
MNDASRLNANAIVLPHMSVHASGGTSQPTLFDPEQREQIARVQSAIGHSILAFLRARLNNGVYEFCADELREWVAARHPGAPASADRILRALRQAGQVSYLVVNRRASLYRVVSIA